MPDLSPTACLYSPHVATPDTARVRISPRSWIGSIGDAPCPRTPYNPLMRKGLALLLAITAGMADTDPASRIGAREVETRLVAIREIGAQGHPRAEELLLPALQDRDWEVQVAAAQALGARGGPGATDALVDLAVNGPARRVRLAAAAALKRTAPAAAAASIARKLRGETLLVAGDALEVLADPAAAEELEKLLKRRNADQQWVALRGLGALRQPMRTREFAAFLMDDDVRVRTAAVEALALCGDVGAAGYLREALKERTMPAVLQRRHIVAIRRVLLAAADDEAAEVAARMCALSLGGAGSPEADARYARLLGELGRSDAPVGPVEDYVGSLLNAGLRHAGAEVRAATAAALARIGMPLPAPEADAPAEGEEPRTVSTKRVGLPDKLVRKIVDRLTEVAKTDPSPRVRFHAMTAVVTLQGDDAAALLLDRLAADADPMVREEAATVLGRRRIAEAAEPLVRALKDEAWEVAVCAAVSLGRLRDAKGLGGLQEMLGEKDWRRRGGAVVGLGWIRRKPAIPLLVDALRDREPAAAATALEFLRHISGERLEAKPKAWRDWWEQWHERFTFRDTDAAARDAKKYGYAATPAKVYEDLDIVVLQTRRGGDNIQALLEDYGIEHRIVRAASIPKAGLHPYALFVANCPGEITDKDMERIQWYVRAGGYLFSSCWALTHTVQVAFPGVVQKLPTRAQVLDTVLAEPCPSESPFLRGVLDGVTQPLYALEGSHLIDVLDPERFEVLLDSPECATRWGDGNLAGWFAVGHGLILDSANHFDMQGMMRADVKSEKDRMAFALDHLGYDFGELRNLADEGVFAKQPLAIKRTRDLSTFRFITTFVRQKRIADGG